VSVLVQEKMSDTERWIYHLFPLLAGKKAWKNGIACMAVGGIVQPGSATAGLVMIGRFAETIDATGLVNKPVNVNLGMEIEVEWWANAGAVVAADIMTLAYVADDQSVSTDDTGGVLAGLIWAVDAKRGVAVQKLQYIPIAP
jgi:hypothetical protein